MNTKRATSKKWRVILRAKWKQIFVGDFHTFEQAKEAYEAALAKYRDPDFKRDIGPVAVPEPVAPNSLNSNNTSGHANISIRPGRVNAFIVKLIDRRAPSLALVSTPWKKPRRPLPAAFNIRSCILTLLLDRR